LSAGRNPLPTRWNPLSPARNALPPVGN